MNTPKKHTSIRVTDETKQLVKSLKRSLRMDSADSVIHYALIKLKEDAARNGGDVDDEEPQPMEIDGDESVLSYRPFAFDVLIKQPQAIKFWTGLKPALFDWVVAALTKAVRRARFFVAACVDPVGGRCHAHVIDACLVAFRSRTT